MIDPIFYLQISLISHTFILLAHGNLAAVVEVAPLHTSRLTSGYPPTGAMWLGFL